MAINLVRSSMVTASQTHFCDSSATVWSPQADNKSLQALSDLLATAGCFCSC
ncbi:hypothetical protein [Cylindrospermopsis raciborskii]|uniref:hypothetical protein n=1 Tax=Cylindrospermopsis raciborskii TaxID=77022 RepID=UPI001454C5D4|nr:hypothetical protein [Cylindrospermopsis raciborskii]